MRVPQTRALPAPHPLDLNRREAVRAHSRRRKGANRRDGGLAVTTDVSINPNGREGRGGCLATAAAAAATAWRPHSTATPVPDCRCVAGRGSGVAAACGCFCRRCRRRSRRRGSCRSGFACPGWPRVRRLRRSERPLQRGRGRWPARRRIHTRRSLLQCSLSPRPRLSVLSLCRPQPFPLFSHAFQFASCRVELSVRAIDGTLHRIERLKRLTQLR